MSKKLEPSIVLEPIQNVLDAIACEDFPPPGTTFLELAEQIKPLLAFDVSSIDACKGAAATRLKVMSMRDEAFYILCAVARQEAAQAA